MNFFARLLITAGALWAAVLLVPGITFAGPWYHLLIVALVFGLVNAFLRPLLTILTCPLILLTLGLFALVLNAFMLWLTSALAGALGIEFHVSGFIAAFIGGLVIAIVSAVLGIFVRDEREQPE